MFATSVARISFSPLVPAITETYGVSNGLDSAEGLTSFVQVVAAKQEIAAALEHRAWFAPGSPPLYRTDEFFSSGLLHLSGGDDEQLPPLSPL